MTRMKRILVIIAGIWLMLMIVDSKQAFWGAKNGVDLCVGTVIPSLLPFFILSMIVTGSLASTDNMLIRQLSGLMNIPESAASVLVPAFLGGYPIGAKAVADLHDNGAIEKEEAARLLAFCSNAGPSFLFGMLSPLFPDGKMLWQLWAIHILGAMVTASIYPVPGLKNGSPVKPNVSKGKTDVMWSSLKALSLVCGWIILFRSIISFMDSWILWRFPPLLRVMIIGTLELANGCCELLRIQDISLRFVICSCLLSMGGICVLFQTSSVTGGLPIKSYLAGKGIQTVFSLAASTLLITSSGMLYVVAFFVFLLSFMKNKSGNLRPYPV